MGHGIKIREFDADITLPLKDLISAFAQSENCKIESYSIKNEVGVKIICSTETGWVGIWAKTVKEDVVNIYARGSSNSFYSRNGRWFLDTLEDLAVVHKGNLLLITREVGTGGGSTTIISEGEMIRGCFSHKLGSPYGFRSIWKSQYNLRKDVSKPIDMKIHDIAKDTTEMIRVEAA